MGIFKKRGKWWISYRGIDGKRHREAASHSYTLAKEILISRQNAVVERKNFPERSSRIKPFTDLSKKFWELHGQHLRSKSWGYLLKHLDNEFGDITTRSQPEALTPRPTGIWR